jgi:hypothetical protein
MNILQEKRFDRLDFIGSYRGGVQSILVSHFPCNTWRIGFAKRMFVRYWKNSQVQTQTTHITPTKHTLSLHPNFCMCYFSYFSTTPFFNDHLFLENAYFIERGSVQLAEVVSNDGLVPLRRYFTEHPNVIAYFTIKDQSGLHFFQLIFIVLYFFFSF